MIYLDNAATTFPKPEKVYERLNDANRNAFNTGRGSYKKAKLGSQLIDNVREKLLKLNNINSGKVIFTSSATQALNDIIFNIEVNENDNIYISPFEHNSIVRAIEELKRRKKINVYTLPFEKNSWNIDTDKMNNMFALHKPKVVLLSHVSNVTGYILPYKEIFESSIKYDAINVLDSSQGYGIVKIDDIQNINYIVFAGHKSLYASFGIAGFIKLKNDKLDKIIFGGTGSDTMNPNMESYEAGSPNIVAISGLDESIDWLMCTDVYSEEKEMTQYLINELKNIDKIKLFIPENEDVFGIVSFGIDGYSSDEIGSILDDEFDISVRTGFHCAPLVHDFIGSLEYNGSVRISISYFTSKEDVDALINALMSL